MKASILWIVTALAVAGASWSTMHRPDARVSSSEGADTRAPGSVTHSPPQSDPMRAEVDELRREMALLKSVVAERSRASTQPTFSAQSAKAEPVSDADVSSQADDEQRFFDHVATVAASFSSETRDQTWANEVGIALESALATEELKSLSLQSIDCRTKTCRVEIDEDASVLAGALPHLALQMAGTLPNMVSQRTERQNGSATVVLYMSRD